jgi:rhamnogalacturonyl hydrolase YesR
MPTNNNENVKLDSMKKTLLSIILLALVPIALNAQKNNTVYFEKEYIKSELIKVTDWQLNHFKRRSLNSWTSAVFYIGLYSAWEATNSQPMYNALISMGNVTSWEPAKNWSNADDIAICQVYTDMFRVGKKHEMIQATADTLALFKTRPLELHEGAPCLWWWADALFMAPATFIKAGVTLKDPEYLELNDRFYKESYDLLYNKKERLFARDLKYIIKNDGKDIFEENGKPIYWLRGNGWVFAGLTRIINELPQNYSNRAFYIKLYKEIANRIIQLQQEDGLWRAGLLDQRAYNIGEESGSALFCYGLAWGINNGFLKEKKYKTATLNSWIGLQKCVNNDGRVGAVQGAGSAPVKIINPENTELYGTGAFLMAGSEIVKIKY